MRISTCLLSLAMLTSASLATTSATAQSLPAQSHVVIDQIDSVSDAGKNALYHELQAKFPSLTWRASSLESETKIEVASVDSEDADALISYLASDSRIQNVEPEMVYTATGILNLAHPNDPLYDKQWNMQAVEAEKAWGYTQGMGVTVAVVDTGIDCSLKDLEGTSCSYGLNAFDGTMNSVDRQSHGSHCAGTIAQTTNNGYGVAGMASKVNLMAVKVLSDSGSGTNQSVADGIRWAADNGAQVISMSLGGSGRSGVIEDAVKHAISKGVILVAANGNDGGRIGYPAGYDGVLAIAASGPDGKEAKFTSRGPETFLAAPGVDIVQETVCVGQGRGCKEGEKSAFLSYSGTSMATPGISASVAALISLGVTDPEAIKSRLKSSAIKNDYTSANPNLFGTDGGILNVGNAVEAESRYQAIVRGLFLVVLSWFAYRKTKAKKSLLKFYLPAMLVGVGLFFVPYLVSFPHPVVQALTRPLVELTSLYSTKLTGFLVLANVAIPAALLVASWHLKSLRTVVAGVSTGVAAYLGGLLWMKNMALPFGSLGLPLVALNILGCVYLAKFCLRHKDAEMEAVPAKG